MIGGNGAPRAAIDVLYFAITDQHMRLVRLALTDFRNYAAITWRPGSTPASVADSSSEARAPVET